MIDSKMRPENAHERHVHVRHVLSISSIGNTNIFREAASSWSRIDEVVGKSVHLPSPFLFIKDFRSS